MRMRRGKSWHLPGIPFAVLVCASGGAMAAEPGPSLSRGKVHAGSIEAMICADCGLSALDPHAGGRLAEASRKAANECPPVLKAKQRGQVAEL